CEQATTKQLLGLFRRDQRHGAGFVLGFVGGARNHDAHRAAAAIPEPPALLEPDALDLALKGGVGDLHPLLEFHLRGGDVSPALRLDARWRWRRRVRRLRLLLDVLVERARKLLE